MHWLSRRLPCIACVCGGCSYESKVQIDVHWQLFEKDTDNPLGDEMKSSEFFGEVRRVLCG